MPAPQRTKPKVGQTQQEMQNQGFDEKYNVPAIQLLVENAAQDAALRWPADASGIPRVSVGTDITLNASDIEIGAVEIKDGTTDQRATVDGTGALKVAGSLAVAPSTASTPVTTSVAHTASNATYLAANSSRLGASLYNDSSTTDVYLKLGATATVSSFTIRMAPGGYYEVPFNYVGIIDGISSAASGNMRVTQVTA